MISNTRKFSYLLLIVLSIASGWLLKLNGIEDDKIPALRHSPDFFSTDYVKWEMDDRGLPKKKLVVDKMEHYADDGVTRFQNPKVDFKNHPSVSWAIRSEAGELSNDGKDLKLTGAVIIERGPSEKQRMLKIITRNLQVKPEINQAETQERVEILSPPSVTTGVGMKMFFAEPVKLRLLANVKGKYEK